MIEWGVSGNICQTCNLSHTPVSSVKHLSPPVRWPGDQGYTVYVWLLTALVSFLSLQVGW